MLFRSGTLTGRPFSPDQFDLRLATGWPGVSPDLTGSWTEGLSTAMVRVLRRQGLAAQCPDSVTRPDLISRRTSAPFWRYALLRHPTITTPAILAAWACSCLPSIGYDVGMQALRLVLATTVAFAAASAQPAVLGATSHTPCSLCAYRNSSDRRISRFNSSTLAHCLLDWRRAVSIDGMIPPWARRPHSAVQSV